MECEGEKLRLIKEMPHIVPSIVAMKHNLRGHISAPSLSSGAGLSALDQAYNLIKDGHQDAVIVGGLDFNVNRNVIGGMEAFGALTTREDFMEFPEDGARPFDPERSGTVISDGGAAMVLASEKFWKSNSSSENIEEIYCEISGFG